MCNESPNRQNISNLCENYSWSFKIQNIRSYHYIRAIWNNRSVMFFFFLFLQKGAIFSYSLKWPHIGGWKIFQNPSKYAGYAKYWIFGRKGYWAPYMTNYRRSGWKLWLKHLKYRKSGNDEIFVLYGKVG